MLAPPPLQDLHNDTSKPQRVVNDVIVHTERMVAHRKLLGTSAMVRSGLRVRLARWLYDLLGGQRGAVISTYSGTAAVFSSMAE